MTVLRKEETHPRAFSGGQIPVRTFHPGQRLAPRLGGPAAGFHSSPRLTTESLLGQPSLEVPPLGFLRVFIFLYHSSFPFCLVFSSLLCCSVNI